MLLPLNTGTVRLWGCSVHELLPPTPKHILSAEFVSGRLSSYFRLYVGSIFDVVIGAPCISCHILTPPHPRKTCTADETFILTTVPLSVPRVRSPSAGGWLSWHTIPCRWNNGCIERPCGELPKSGGFHSADARCGNQPAHKP